MKTPWKNLLIVASLTLVGVGALAQKHSAIGEHAGMFDMHHMGSTHMEERVNRHLNELKRKLHIKASQEPAWTTFGTAMKPPTAALMPSPDRAEMEKLSTPERIDKLRQLRTQHHEAMKPFMDQRDEAIKTFYATLDSAQKKTFDAEHSHMMRRGAMNY